MDSVVPGIRTVPTCHILQRKKKSVSVISREWLIFPGFVFLPIYFSRVSPPPPLFFCSLVSSVTFVQIFLHCLFSSICFLLCSSTLKWICVAKIQPWGYIASFIWGPVVTLKAHKVVCRFASAQLSLSAQRNPARAWLSAHSLSGGNISQQRKTWLHPLPVIVYMYACMYQICKALKSKSFKADRCLTA